MWRLGEAATKAYQMPLKKFIDDIERYRRMIEKMCYPWREFEQSLSAITTFPSIQVFNQWIHAMQNQQDEINRLFAEPVLRLRQSIKNWARPVELLRSDLLAISKVYSKAIEPLRNVVLMPSINYGKFVESTSLELQRPRIHRVTKTALRASVDCAGLEISAENDLISTYPGAFSLELMELSEEDSSAPTMNLFSVQKDDLLYIVRQNPEIIYDEDILQQLPSCQYTGIARLICQRVVDCNNSCATKGRHQIFKPTNRMVESLVALPMLLAIDRTSFAEYVDHLYFIIYEAAGKDTLRLLQFIDEREAQAVWDIKQLRNYVYRHDVEHGDEKDILKKQKAAGLLFQRLIRKNYPRSREDFRIMQIRLASNMLAMLNRILARIEQAGNLH